MSFVKDQSQLVGIQFPYGGSVYRVVAVSDLDFGFYPPEFTCRVEQVG